MLPLLALAAIGAGIGATKHFAVDKPKEKRQRELAAKTQELSPWTGLQAGDIQEGDLAGSLIGGGLAGASFGQNMAGFDHAQKMQTHELAQAKGKTKLYDRMNNSPNSPLVMNNLMTGNFNRATGRNPASSGGGQQAVPEWYGEDPYKVTF